MQLVVDTQSKLYQTLQRWMLLNDGGEMSIGIGGKVFGQGFEWFVGYKEYKHSLAIMKVSVLDLNEKLSFSLLSFEVAIRW